MWSARSSLSSVSSESWPEPQLITNFGRASLSAVICDTSPPEAKRLRSRLPTSCHAPATTFTSRLKSGLRKPAAQKLTQSETRICSVTLSFESCRKMLCTWQSSHGYPSHSIARSRFCGPQRLVGFDSHIAQIVESSRDVVMPERQRSLRSVLRYVGTCTCPSRSSARYSKQEARLPVPRQVVKLKNG